MTKPDPRAARLAALANHATRYEVALTLPNGTRHRLAYSSRKSFPGLVWAYTPHGHRMLALMPDLSLDAQITKKNGAFHFANAARIEFTGRTQRDAINAGELPHITEQDKPTRPDRDKPTRPDKDKPTRPDRDKPTRTTAPRPVGTTQPDLFA